MLITLNNQTEVTALLDNKDFMSKHKKSPVSENSNELTVVIKGLSYAKASTIEDYLKKHYGIKKLING